VASVESRLELTSLALAALSTAPKRPDLDDAIERELSTAVDNQSDEVKWSRDYAAKAVQQMAEAQIESVISYLDRTDNSFAQSIRGSVTTSQQFFDLSRENRQRAIDSLPVDTLAIWSISLAADQVKTIAQMLDSFQLDVFNEHRQTMSGKSVHEISSHEQARTAVAKRVGELLRDQSKAA
jgi:hypothetical protein